MVISVKMMRVLPMSQKMSKQIAYWVKAYSLTLLTIAHTELGKILLVISVIYIFAVCKG